MLLSSGSVTCHSMMMIVATTTSCTELATSCAINNDPVVTQYHTSHCHDMSLTHF